MIDTDLVTSIAILVGIATPALCSCVLLLERASALAFAYHIWLNKKLGEATNDK